MGSDSRINGVRLELVPAVSALELAKWLVLGENAEQAAHCSKHDPRDGLKGKVYRKCDSVKIGGLAIWRRRKECRFIFSIRTLSAIRNK